MIPGRFAPFASHPHYADKGQPLHERERRVCLFRRKTCWPYFRDSVIAKPDVIIQFGVFFLDKQRPRFRFTIEVDTEELVCLHDSLIVTGLPVFFLYSVAIRKALSRGTFFSTVSFDRLNVTTARLLLFFGVFDIPIPPMVCYLSRTSSSDLNMSISL